MLAALVAAFDAVTLHAQMPTSVPAFALPAVVTLAAWAVLCAAFTGVGALALYLLRSPGIGFGAIFAAFWLGVAATLAWLQVWSLWLPVGWQALLPLLVVAAVGWRVTWRAHLQSLVSSTRDPRFLAGVAALAIWAAVTAQAPLTLYDAGLYHMPAMRWASTDPVVPGLGNLNPAFGLGSSVFLYLASAGVAGVHGYHIGLGLLLVVLLIELCVSLTRRPATLDTFFSALLVMPALVFIGTAGLSTTMYDVGSFVLSLVAGRSLLRLLDASRVSAQQAFVALVVIATLCCAAITVKISNVPFSATCIGVALFVSLKTTRRNPSQSLAALALVAVVGVVLLGPWLVRNIVLTGYPLYPLPVLGLPFDWTMPEATVRTYTQVLSDFARVRGPGYEGASGSLTWLGHWLSMSWRDIAVPVVVGVVASAALLICRRHWASRIGQRWLILIPIWVGIAAWFTTSPDPRYATALLWLAAATPVAFWMMHTPPFARLLLGVLFLAAAEMPSATYLVNLVEVPGAVLSGQFASVPDVPSVPLTTVTTNSGLVVFTPADGGDQVWDAPLPATGQRPDANLRLRCANRLSCGFSVR